jgi:hypothetical protein
MWEISGNPLWNNVDSHNIVMNLKQCYELGWHITYILTYRAGVHVHGNQSLSMFWKMFEKRNCSCVVPYKVDAWWNQMVFAFPIFNFFFQRPLLPSNDVVGCLAWWLMSSRIIVPSESHNLLCNWSLPNMDHPSASTPYFRSGYLERDGSNHGFD